MTVERAAEIMDPKSKEKFYGESGKQEVLEAMPRPRQRENLHKVLLGLAAGIGGGVSMAQIVTAQFVGMTSCGFVTGKYYEIEVSAGRSGCLCVRDVQGQGLCLYTTLENLKSNWRVLDLRKTENR